jgi:hypothetical protein
VNTPPPGYQLNRAEHGTAVLGLLVPQVLLLAAGIGSLIGFPALHGGVVGLVVGGVVGTSCAVLALWPAGGRPGYTMVPVLARFGLCQVRGGGRWTAPLPLLSGRPGPDDDLRVGAPTGRRSRRGRSATPRCLAGLELHAVPRPSWAHEAGSRRESPPDVGLVRDGRTGTATVILDVRGGPFTLLDPSSQHARLADWGRVLDQFARESSPVRRLGWSLWTTVTAPVSDLDRLRAQAPSSPSEAMSTYVDLVEATGSTTVYRHELRTWITVDPALITGRDSAKGQDEVTASALAAGEALAERCTAAGLAVSGPLSPVEIAEAIRVQADPSTSGGLSRAVERALAAEDRGAADVTAVHAAPLSVASDWDAVRIDDAWHRVFWLSQWPSTTFDPRWLEPLLLAPPCVRTLAVSYEPIPLRTSRRRITAESVALQSQVEMRERHGIRIGVPLQRAQADVDRREAELVAGHCEYGYLALLAVTGTDRADLDANSHMLLDQAAQCGIVELRPLHGRHDAAWACTLPLGRVPRRELFGGHS